MSKIPLVSGRKVVKVLARVGYEEVRQKGSHVRLHHCSKKPLTVPDHKILGKGLLRKILRDAEISLDDFKELLK